MSVRKDKITMEDIEAAMQLVAEALELEEASPNTWEEHIAAATRAEEAQAAEKASVEEEVTDLSTMPLVDKLGAVLHDSLDMILTGKILVETGAELLHISQAVALRESLRASLDD